MTPLKTVKIKKIKKNETNKYLNGDYKSSSPPLSTKSLKRHSQKFINFQSPKI